METGEAAGKMSRKRNISGARNIRGSSRIVNRENVGHNLETSFKRSQPTCNLQGKQSGMASWDSTYLSQAVRAFAPLLPQRRFSNSAADSPAHRSSLARSGDLATGKSDVYLRSCRVNEGKTTGMTAVVSRKQREILIGRVCSFFVFANGGRRESLWKWIK